MGENCTGVSLANRIKGTKLAKGSAVENTPRKCLADVSNLPQPNHGMKLQAYSPKTKEYIHKLHQEVVSLMKLLADRNKIIQLHELELQKLKTIFLQMQQKNQLFAKTNSQMLGELNAAKDKLKVLQHELGCKNGLLAVRNLESEVEPTNCDDVKKPSRADEKNNAPCNKKRIRKSKSLDNNSVNAVQDQEKNDDKRHSIKFDNVEELPTEDVSEISDTLFTDKPTQIDSKVDEKRRRSRKLTRSTQEKPAAVVEKSDVLDPSTAKLALAEQTVDEKTKYENKAENKRRPSRRQSARSKVEEEEPTTMVESSDTLDLTTSEPVQPEMKIDDKRRISRRRSTKFKFEEEKPIVMVESSDTLDQTTNKPVQAEMRTVEKRRNSRRQSTRFKVDEEPIALDQTTSKPVQPEMRTDDTRVCSKRQSASFIQQEQLQEEPKRDISKTDDMEVRVSSAYECGSLSTPSASLARIKYETPDCLTGSEGVESRRTLRPKRQATEKVQSYKEIPVNIKMRRCE